MRTARLLIVGAICVIVFTSCMYGRYHGNKRNLEDMVQDIQNGLPSEVSEGMTFVRVELEDTMLVFSFEIDDKKYPFEGFIEANSMKSIIIQSTISNMNRTQRKLYEMCLANNVYIKYVYVGKYSYKETTMIVSPYEIEQAFNSSIDPQQVLSMSIDFQKRNLPKKIEEGLIMTDIELRDSFVYYISTIDEDLYVFENIVNIRDEIKNKMISSENYNRVDAIFLEMIANARYGMVYRFVGRSPERIIDIAFTTNEMQKITDKHKVNEYTIP